MTKQKDLRASVVEDYMDRFPTTPNKTLAKKIFKEASELFKDVDQIRSFIRRRYGQQGGIKMADKSRYKEAGENAITLGIGNPYGLPEAQEEPWEPYILPKACKRFLILSDVHIPYHDIKAITMALDYAKEQKIDAIVLNGDIMDCYAVSRWEKDPRKRKFKGELEDTRQFLQALNRMFDVPIYYKIGNHEERYEAYLRIKAPELLDISEFRLDVLLRFAETNTHLITDKRVIKAGRLNIMHGHEFGRSVFSPVNPARGYYMKSKTNTICGHNHQTSEHTEPDLNGNVVTTWSTGCLSHLHPEYMPINKWNLGFAMVYVDSDDGGFDVENLRIINGKIR